MFFNPQRYDLEPVGRYKMNKRLKLDVADDQISLTKEDVLGTMKYVTDLYNGDQNVHTDDIDNLSNRRIRGVGELLLMQIKTGLAKMNKMVKEKMTTQDIETVSPQSLFKYQTSKCTNTRFLWFWTIITIHGPIKSTS